jgi:hypothetical protein
LNIDELERIENSQSLTAADCIESNKKMSQSKRKRVCKKFELEFKLNFVKANNT